MSEFASLTVAGLEVFSCQNEPTPEALTLFRESDRLVIPLKEAARRGLVSYDVEGTDEDPREFFCYVNSARNVTNRLETMGFHLSDVESAFNENLAALIESKSDDSYFGDSDSPEMRELRGRHAEFLKFLAGYTYNKWRHWVANQLGHGQPGGADDAQPSDTEFLDKIQHDVFGYGDDFHVGFPQDEDSAADFRLVIRGVLDLAAPHDPVVYDYTSIVGWSWVDEDTKLCEDTMRALLGPYPTHERIIVLTEGSSDSLLLSRSLKLLYPHLHGYYSFLDFFSSSVPGGASQLVAVVKAFAGAGIRNRVVAVFDNDTAAAEALVGLEGVSVPDTVRVVRLPRIDLAASYPTLGPTGEVPLDVNGLAGSLELYFCPEVLSASGRLTPIQWKGFSERVGQYHGELLHKKGLQSRYSALLVAMEAEPAQLDRHDWGAMRLALRSILTAFGASID